MNTLDIIIVIIYLCAIVAVGLLVQKKASRNMHINGEQPITEKS